MTTVLGHAGFADLVTGRTGTAYGVTSNWNCLSGTGGTIVAYPVRGHYGIA